MVPLVWAGLQDFILIFVGYRYNMLAYGICARPHDLDMLDSMYVVVFTASAPPTCRISCSRSRVSLTPGFRRGPSEHTLCQPRTDGLGFFHCR